MMYRGILPKPARGFVPLLLACLLAVPPVAAGTYLHRAPEISVTEFVRGGVRDWVPHWTSHLGHATEAALDLAREAPPPDGMSYATVLWLRQPAGPVGEEAALWAAIDARLASAWDTPRPRLRAGVVTALVAWPEGAAAPTLAWLRGGARLPEIEAAFAQAVAGLPRPAGVAFPEAHLAFAVGADRAVTPLPVDRLPPLAGGRLMSRLSGTGPRASMDLPAGLAGRFRFRIDDTGAVADLEGEPGVARELRRQAESISRMVFFDRLRRGAERWVDFPLDPNGVDLGIFDRIADEGVGPPPLIRASAGTAMPERVELEFVVGFDGRPREIRVLESGGERYDRPCIEALERWRFRPATEDGRPVLSRRTQTFLFGATVERTVGPGSDEPAPVPLMPVRPSSIETQRP